MADISPVTAEKLVHGNWQVLFKGVGRADGLNRWSALLDSIGITRELSITYPEGMITALGNTALKPAQYAHLHQ